jgi:hypothetical protein
MTENEERRSKAGAILVAAVVAVSAVGVLGWHLLQNRGGERGGLDVSGFDLASAPASPRPALPLPSPGESAPQASGLGMLKADAGMRVVDSNAGGESAGTRAAASKAQEQASSGRALGELCRKYEKRVNVYFLAKTRQYPSVRAYGRDWMSYPDLKKLNDDYFRDRDPVKFMRGLSRSENFGKLAKKYSNDPAIRAVVVDAAKQAPADLMSAGLDFINNDKTIKTLLGSVARGMGLPAGLMAIFDESKGGKLDQQQVMDGVLKSNPEARKALEQQQGSGISIGR